MEVDSNEILDRKSLLEYLLTLARENRSGMLSVTVEDATSYFLFQDGMLAAAAWGPEEDFLRHVIEENQLVPEKTLRKALKRSQSRKLDLATALSQEGGPLPARVRETMGSIVQEELWRLAGHEGTWWQFNAELPEVPPFDPDLLALNMKLNVEFLVVDIAGRESDWTILDQVFPAHLEVLVTRAASRRYFDSGPGKYDQEQSILVLIDGERDVDEVLKESPLDPYTTLKLLHRFKIFGEIRELNPAELIQVAMTFKAKGRFDKRLKLYLRAEVLGNNAFDLDLTIGNIYETIGKTDDAFARYLSFAQKCLDAGERGPGTEAFRRAVALRPSNIEIREKFLQMLDPVENRNEYRKEIRTYLGLARSSQDTDRIRHALGSLVTVGGASRDDLDEYISVLNRKGGPREAFQDLWRIAQDLEKDDRTEEVVPILEAAASLRPESLAVHEKLADAFVALGETDLAARALNCVASLVRQEDITPEARNERLTEVYRRLLDLDPDHVEALRFLATRARHDGQDEQAVAFLLRLKVIYEEAGLRPRVAYVLSQLIRLQPHDPDLHLAYAECQLAAGRRFRGATSLRQAASRLAMNEETLDHAESMYRKALAIVPFDRIGRRELAELYEAAGDHPTACEQWEVLAETARIEGDTQEAIEVYERLHRDQPDETSYLRRLAQMWLRRLPYPDATGRLHELMEKLIKLEDFGLVRWLVNAGGNPPPLRKLVDTLPDRRHVKALKAQVAHLRALQRQRRVRVVNALRRAQTKLQETQQELDELKSSTKTSWEEARAAWEQELDELLAERELQVEARLRAALSDHLAPHAGVVSPQEGGEDAFPGLSGGIKKMETTFNLPSSIKEITRKLKGIK